MEVHQFQSDVEISSSLLTRPSALQSSNPFWNAIATNEGEVGPFWKSGYKNGLATSLERSQNECTVNEALPYICQS